MGRFKTRFPVVAVVGAHPVQVARFLLNQARYKRAVEARDPTSVIGAAKDCSDRHARRLADSIGPEHLKRLAVADYGGPKPLEGSWAHTACMAVYHGLTAAVLPTLVSMLSGLFPLRLQPAWRTLCGGAALALASAGLLFVPLALAYARLRTRVGDLIRSLPLPPGV